MAIIEIDIRSTELLILILADTYTYKYYKYYQPPQSFLLQIGAIQGISECGGDEATKPKPKSTALQLGGGSQILPEKIHKYKYTNKQSFPNSN